MEAIIDGQPARAITIGRRYVKADIGGAVQLISRQAWDAAVAEAERRRAEAAAAKAQAEAAAFAAIQFRAGVMHARAHLSLASGNHKNRDFCRGYTLAKGGCYFGVKGGVREEMQHLNNPVPCNDNMGAPRREQKERSS